MCKKLGRKGLDNPEASFWIYTFLCSLELNVSLLSFPSSLSTNSWSFPTLTLLFSNFYVLILEYFVEEMIMTEWFSLFNNKNKTPAFLSFSFYWVNTISSALSVYNLKQYSIVDTNVNKECRNR